MRSFNFSRMFSLSLTLLFSFLSCSCAPLLTHNVAGACSSRLGSSISNFCEVTPNVLWRGSRPDKEGAAWLIQTGVRTVVNLELLLDDRPAFGRATLADAGNYSVGYYRIHDWEALPVLAPSLTDDHIAHFLAIVSQQPKPVYVHCRSGMNRTGVMVAAYRILVEGMSEEEAIEEMSRYQGLWFEADATYIRGLSSEQREKIRQKINAWIPELKKDAQIACAGRVCAVSD